MTIRTFRFWPDGRLEKSAALPDRSTLQSGDACVWWVDLWAPASEVIDELAGLLDLDPNTAEGLRDEDRRASIDYFDDYCSLLLYGMLGASPQDPPRPRQVNLICTQRVLVTVHDLSIGSIERLIERVDRFAHQVIKKGVGHLLFLKIDAMVDNGMALARRYEQELEVLEDRSVDINCSDDLLEDLSDVRRRVLDLWQVQVAQREVLIELCEEDVQYLTPESRRQMEHVRDHMTSSLEIVEILRGMVGEVRENYRTTLSLRSAEAMNKLTVFAGLMLPMSLIAGIYGMNVPLWPDPTRPSTFWLIMAAMGGVLGVLMVYFKRRNWI